MTTTIDDRIIALQKSLLADYEEIDRLQQLAIAKQEKLKVLESKKSKLQQQ